MTRKTRQGDTRTVLPLGSADAGAGAHVAIVPGVQAPVYPVDLPTGLRHAPRERIARRQIAERLGLPEATLDIRPLGSGPDWTHVLVCDADRAAGWRASATLPGCTAILPDYLALPTAEGIWTLRTTDTGIAARLGPTDGFGADAQMALTQLRLAAATSAPRAVLLLGTPPPALTDLLQDLSLPAFRNARDLAAAGHPVPRHLDLSDSPANLLAPADAAVRSLRRQLRDWSIPAVVALLALGLWCAGTWWQIDRDRTRLAQIRTGTETLLRDSFLPSGPILDIQMQVTRRLAQIETAGAPTDALSPVDLFRRAAPLLASDGVALQSLDYRPEAGLEAAVSTPDFARVEDLAEALRAAGLAVAVVEARAEDGGQVRARLQLDEG